MMQLSLSETASKKLKELIAKNGTVEDTYLRVYVAGGGCSGFRYGMALDNKVHEGDEVVQPMVERARRALAALRGEVVGPERR